MLTVLKKWNKGKEKEKRWGSGKRKNAFQNARRQYAYIFQK